MIASWFIKSKAILASASILLASVVGVGGYVLILKKELSDEKLIVQRLNTDLAIALANWEVCKANLKNVREARESDAEVTEDTLDDIPILDFWGMSGP